MKGSLCGREEWAAIKMFAIDLGMSASGMQASMGGG